jgi:membrane protein implicated in regulation of membrane protease activity
MTTMMLIVTTIEPAVTAMVFISVAMLIAVAVAATIVTMTIVSMTVTMAMSMPIVVTVAQMQAEQDATDKTIGKVITIVGLGRGAEGEGCCQYRAENECLAIHGLPPFFSLNIRLRWFA